MSPPASGSANQNSLPCPGALETPTCPPTATAPASRDRRDRMAKPSIPRYSQPLSRRIFSTVSINSIGLNGFTR